MKRVIIIGMGFILSMSFCIGTPLVGAQSCEKPACRSGDKYDARQRRCESGPDFWGYRSHYEPTCPAGYDLDLARGVCVKRGECCEKPACKKGYTYRNGRCNSEPTFLGYRSHYTPDCGAGWSLDRATGVCKKNNCPSGGMLIQRVEPAVAFPGDVIEIRGVHFGDRQGSKIPAINLGRVNRLVVLSWSDTEVRARIPNGLAPGRYVVLIYYDESFRNASNSLEVTLQAR